MKAVVAMDSFKGSLTSREAGEAVKRGIQRAVGDDAEIVIKPLADGGEGTVKALAEGLNGTMCRVVVPDPLGRPVRAEYAILPNTGTAVMEMAAAAGLTLLKEEERDPLRTSTRGVGELIRDAIGKGIRRFLIGIGGSATNDGGMGMLTALGYSFLDANGHQIEDGAAGLSSLVSISDVDVLPELKECRFQIACDVTNPLCGELGCSSVYGPQKGAYRKDIERMDRWLSNYASIVKQKYPKSDADAPGAGAAGGLGFAFQSFMDAVLNSGIALVMKETGIEEDIRMADVVITGEGRLDAQTAMGKAPVGLARLAKRYEKPVIAFAGSVTPEASACNRAGIDAFFPILRRVTSLAEAMDRENAASNLADAAEQVFRLWNLWEQKFY